MVALQNPNSTYYAAKVPLASWDEQSMIKLSNSRLWSLPPEDYRSMHGLESPASKSASCATRAAAQMRPSRISAAS